VLDLIEGFRSIVVDSVLACLISTDPIVEGHFDAQDESERAIFLT
jgi:CRISPR/Cas system-associated endonuclease Cas1